MSENEPISTPAPSMFNFPNIMANMIYHIEQEIDEAVDEKRVPFGATVSASETGNSYLFENIKFAENEEMGINSKATVYVARVKVEEREGQVKYFYQICVDSYVDDLLMGQFRHSTDSEMFNKARDAYEAPIVVSKNSNLRK